MLTQEQKARRYDILSYAFQQKINNLKRQLADELDCSVETIPDFELEKRLERDIKSFMDEFFDNQNAVYYLLDYMIYEQTNILPLKQNPYYRDLNCSI